MADVVKGSAAPRRYTSPKRQEQARATRRAIVEAARALFLARGYAGTTIDAVAGEAGVAVQTVYAAFGSKAQILKTVLDVAVVGDDAPVPLVDREAVKAFGLGSLPAIVHLGMDGHIVNAVEGWDAMAWRALTIDLSRIVDWTRPVLPAPRDPGPFPGAPLRL